MGDIGNGNAFPDLLENFSLKNQTNVQKPKMYKVIMHNDHYTTMEFVVETLRSIFRKTEATAISIMLDIHTKGSGFCGVYTKEIAETKIRLVHEEAREAGFPLRCSMEKD